MAQIIDDAADTLSESDFRFLADLVHRRTQIVLGPEKRAMLRGRLLKRQRSLGLDSLHAYVKLMSGPGADAELPELLNAVTTNVTAFFREMHHFTHLRREVLPSLLMPGRTRSRIRIWSAGCSIGAEPYSIAMALHVALRGRAGIDARILATDIDTKVLEQGRRGEYSADQSDGIPPRLRAEYTEDDGRGGIVMDPRLRALVTFKPLNLIERWPMRGPFDVVFCRNVVIYFNKETQRTLFSRIADLMTQSGVLYIGHSESLFQVSDRFKLIGKTTYQKVA
jgi:chemotaxis protein methyltransferase CheR